MLDRLKQYIEAKGLTIAAVERTLGMSNGALAKPIKNHTAIGSDKLENILAFSPDLSLTWLFTGRGEMLTTEVYAHKTSSDTEATLTIENKLLKSMVAEKDATIQQQAKEIGRLEQQIAELKQRFEKDAEDAGIGRTANVG